MKGRTSCVLQQGKVRVVLTTPMGQMETLLNTLNYRDGVKVIALWVDDATKSFEETQKEEQKPICSQRLKKMSLVKLFVQEFMLMVICSYFCRAQKFIGVFLPGYTKQESAFNPKR